MLRSRNTKLPKLDGQKHPQTVIEPPPYFTVGNVYFASNFSFLLLQTITLPLLPNKLSLDSSLQRTVFQEFSGLADIMFANLRRFNRLALLTYGRFRVTRPSSPCSLAHRLIIRSDMCTPSSCSSSVFTIRVDFLRSHFSLRSISRSARIVVPRFLPRPARLPKHLVASYLLVIFWAEVLGRSISVAI